MFKHPPRPLTEDAAPGSNWHGDSAGSANHNRKPRDYNSSGFPSSSRAAASAAPPEDRYRRGDDDHGVMQDSGGQGSRGSFHPSSGAAHPDHIRSAARFSSSDGASGGVNNVPDMAWRRSSPHEFYDGERPLRGAGGRTSPYGVGSGGVTGGGGGGGGGGWNSAADRHAMNGRMADAGWGPTEIDLTTSVDSHSGRAFRRSSAGDVAEEAAGRRRGYGEGAAGWAGAVMRGGGANMSTRGGAGHLRWAGNEASYDNDGGVDADGGQDPYDERYDAEGRDGYRGASGAVRRRGCAEGTSGAAWKGVSSATSSGGGGSKRHDGKRDRRLSDETQVRDRGVL